LAQVNCDAYAFTDIFKVGILLKLVPERLLAGQRERFEVVINTGVTRFFLFFFADALDT
jgi:hypothetical protein